MSAALKELRERFSVAALPAQPEWGEQAEGRGARSRWSRAALAGRLTELSAAGGAGVLSWAVGLVRDTQREEETAAWVTATESGFYPPDAAANGVDLETLTVVRVPDARGVGRAAGHLARSGAFGLIVLDLGAGAALPAALQGRLVQHAQRHGTAILCLTEKPARAPSLGSLVSLRSHALRQRRGEGRFACGLAVSKDKRWGPGWEQEEIRHGPPGLR
ncbi:MAG: recombinase A [SAR324 cluster bacterium]|nr:recombinase A [SAR324 cluster bacterium]MCZ6554054.1 recombinase A [SAR324 cluster bacterium]MCZ6750088.1 recombinase A [SAR324 cluster bacterium]